MPVYFVFFLLIIGYSINAQPLFSISAERLPGLDELEAGFDAMTMSSVGEKQSTFRIFDLTATGPKKYKFRVLGRERAYSIPPAVQVVDIQKRRDISNEDFSSNYQHFYSNYFRSTRGASGWSAFIFGGGSRTHSTLHRILESLNKSSKAIATSTSWWGHYSIQLGPPFIIKLDPMFEASVNAIVSLGHAPQTESEQSLCNMIIQTFGTHYVTRVIVGATARIFTLLGEEYFKSTSFEEIKTETTRVSRFFFWSTYHTDYTHEIKQSVTESFRRNSQMFVEYQPTVPQLSGKTEWQSWLAKAPYVPVVVNRTVAPISNLFYAHPQIQSHVYRTIQYYLNHGEMPTLNQLR